jgi:pentatricopeptide repeat protein
LFIRDVAANNKDTRILSSAPSSYELNAMLTSLSERNKVSAALMLYRRMIEGVDGIVIEGDAYSASIIFAMLADSIANGGTRSTTIGENFSRLSGDTKDDDDVVSPSWQWKEAISILNTFSSTELNNFAYAALLKVNEQATEVYIDAGARHNGVQCAMSVLERMKVSNYIDHDI